MTNLKNIVISIMTETYFDKMVNNLNNNNNTDNLDFLLNNLITPLSLYFISDHFIGNELERFNIKVKPNSNNLIENNNIKDLKDMQILFVQNDFFDIFIKNILPNIKCKFILITGQWHLPALNINTTTTTLLNDNRIYRWFSQNPRFKHPKYFPLPYGLNYGYVSSDPDIKRYAKELLRTCSKEKNIINLGMNHNTNPCRKFFPKGQRLNNNIFYEEIHKSKFILSPIGDRDDCYRHWEAIGLGTIPISNVGDLYKDIFLDNMIYEKDIKNMIKIFEEQQQLEYKCPDKNLICLDYWKDYIKKISSTFAS